MNFMNIKHSCTCFKLYQMSSKLKEKYYHQGDIQCSTRGGHYIMEIAANFWKAKFCIPNNETHFDFLIGWIPRAHTECPRSLCSVVEQASWALRVRPGDSSDQKIKMGFIIRDVKLSFLEICSNIHDVVATPNVHQVLALFKHDKCKYQWEKRVKL